ncbi:peroxisome assembly factor 2 isoform X3 [Takifugu rubripes]|uniref:peroxisome assembly factor 2 isoform X3 n=1 Tax=Takifugu rubripes TaxID=31033 RepID=UPI001145F796|nr:peroxisome biogenesis factor 6 isoform X3 [Takifugu rubripes]
MTREEMATPAELCCTDSFPPHLSPLDVLLSTSWFHLLFQNNNDSQTVLFSLQRPYGSTIQTILLRVHPTNEEGTTAKSQSRIRLHTSRLFMRYHGLYGLDCTGTVRATEPVKLDRVVLGARSRQSHRWATAGQFTCRLHELCRRQQLLLARRGEPLLLTLNPLPGEESEQVELLVLDCSPVMQGQITADTTVVLTDGFDLMDPQDPLPSRPLRLCMSDFAHYADGLGEGRCLLDSQRLLSSRFCGVLQALQCWLEVKVVDAQHHFGATGIDEDNSVFVSKQLLLQLGLFNHEWVKLWRSGGLIQRLVSVVVVDQIQSPETQKHQEDGFISSTLWFNMTEGEQVPRKSFTLKMKRLGPTVVVGSLCSQSLSRSFAPPFASELHVQLVVSPQYEGLSSYENLLSEHFSTPRVVSQGDILTVPAENHPDLLEHSSEGVQIFPAVFFKVHGVYSRVQEEEVEGDGTYLADRKHTCLYIGASNNSTVPHSSVDGGSLWNSLSFPGLEPTINLLSSIIAPHLQHSSVLPGCTIILSGPAGSGKVTALNVASRRLNLHLLKVNCVSLLAATAAASEAKLMAVFQRVGTVQPCVLLLRNLHFLLRPRGGIEEDGRITGALCRLLGGISSRVAVVATTSRARDLSAVVTAAFVHQVGMESPSEEQRHIMLGSLSQKLSMGMDVNLEKLSKLTMGFVLGDLAALVVAAGRSACQRLRQSCGGQQKELCNSGVTLLNQDFTVALETLQDVQATAFGAPKIPDVRWEDVGGLQQVKKEILDTVQLPLQHPELLVLGLNRTGILLYGPPGTGKTLLAKAVATECSMTFLSVKGPELVNMYVGQSEENIREVFSRARAAAPCIIFFDELDSLAPNRGRTGDSGGVMDRVVSQLLAELDTLSSAVGVFVIGATNRPDLLDQSLLRPGRLDKLVFVGLSEEPETQLHVLQAILRKFQLDPTVNLQQVVERCPAHMSGADLYALCSDAMMVAIKRKMVFMEGEDGEDSPLLLCPEDFTTALESFQPSVSDEELLRYRNIQQKLEGCNNRN